MWVPQLVIFVLIFRYIFVEDQISSCRTPGPDSEDGICVAITECPELLSSLKEGNRTEKEFAQQSLCGLTHPIPLVCCKFSSYIFTNNSPSSFEVTTTSKPNANVTLDYCNNTQYYDYTTPDRTTCGPVQFIDKITDGNETRIGQFPWMAALAYKSAIRGEHPVVRCSGSLINARYVLTAAHCVRNYQPESVLVLLGEWKLSTDPDCISENQCAPKVLKLEVEKMIAHEFYSRLKKKNDIALIRLKYNICFTDYVRPICLPPKGLPPLAHTDLLISAGWGAKIDGSQSDTTFKALVSLISNEECLTIISRTKGILPTEFCARKTNTWVCKGDSGGPLMRIFEDKHHLSWFLEGVLASGVDCHIGVSALVYSRISAFRSWILNTMTAND